MNKICLFLLLLIGSQYSKAQEHPSTFGEIPKTLSQLDWMRQREREAPFSSNVRSAERPAGEGVSVARLLHRPPGKAIAAFGRGLHYADKHEPEKAIAEFQKAVEIDPKFSEAQGNMGTQYVALERYEEAAECFRRALTLDSATGVHHANLGYVLLRLNRLEEAEKEAESAVSLDPTNIKSQYLLGILLSLHPEKHTRAQTHLEYAAREMPEAHFVLAEMFLYDGATESARAEMEHYKKMAAEHPELLGK